MSYHYANGKYRAPVLTEHNRKRSRADMEQYDTFTIEGSCDLFTQKRPKFQSETSSIDHYEQLFRHYSNDQDEINIDGLLRLCQDLAIQPDSYEMLLFCFLCRAQRMYSLTKNELLQGFKALASHTDELHDVRNALIHYSISSCETVFYEWTYEFGLTNGERTLTKHNALSLWQIFFSKQRHQLQIFGNWIEFLTDSNTLQRITNDIWMMLPDFFAFILSNGYESYDASQAWPCMFDNFVEYQQKTKLFTP